MSVDVPWTTYDLAHITDFYGFSTKGNGTAELRYQRKDQRLDFRIGITVGSTTVVTPGQFWGVALPSSILPSRDPGRVAAAIRFSIQSLAPNNVGMGVADIDPFGIGSNFGSAAGIFFYLAHPLTGEVRIASDVWPAAAWAPGDTLACSGFIEGFDN